MPNRAERELPFEDEPKRRSFRRERLVSALDQGDDFWLRRRHEISDLAKGLMRFVRRQVGQPWTQILSELDARLRALKADAALNPAVREYVLSQVVTEASPSSAARPPLRRGLLYVDPQTGILRFRAKRSRKR